jgi:GYF domain 2
MMVVRNLYWIRKDGKESGPFTFWQIQSMWRASNLKVTDEIRRDGKRVWYPVSKIRRGLETSRTAMVGYAMLATILVSLISWAPYLLFH